MKNTDPIRPEEILSTKQLRRLVAAHEAAEMLRSSWSMGPTVAGGPVDQVSVMLLADYIVNGNEES